jgi:hypothetical protein
MQFDAGSVAAVRSQLWAAGFRPLSVATGGKEPIGKDWPERARRDPPDCLLYDPVAHALNTGILADGLRAIDIDIDDPVVARKCCGVVLGRLGEAPVRTRNNSPRCLVLYRAATGAPPKIVLAGTSGKIEVLGRGQQFVAFGRHPTGAYLEWFPEPPGEETAAALPVVTEDDIAALLAELAPVIGADAPKRTNGHDHTAGEPQADPLRIAAALNAIPNTGPADWEAWNRIGMAVWAGTGGSGLGFDWFEAWSRRNPAFDAAACVERWENYRRSPPTSIGAGSIFYMARRAPPEPYVAPPQIPPAHVNGLDDAELASLEAVLREGPQDAGDIAHEPDAKPHGHSLWAITGPWTSAEIPRRPWIARGYLMRGSLTVISGAGAAGKSSLMIAWSAALTVGCAFRHLRARGQVRVATYNVEDDEHEQKRRFSAMFKRLGLDASAFGDRLAILGPRGIGTLLTVARDGSVVLNTMVMDDLETFVAEFRPDVLILDPFVELHGAEENDNTAVRAVLARFRAMAHEHDMAIVLLHHSRKGYGEPGDPDTLRGASSIVGAARVVLTLTVMSKDEAKAFNLPEKSRRNYFRMDGAKSNYAPIDETEWFERQEITLDNGGDGELADRVAVAWPWQPPSIWEHDPTVLTDVLKAIDQGPSPGTFYAPTRRGAANARWVGNVIVAKLETSEEQAKQMIKAWLDTGLLISGNYHDASQRKELPCVRVDFAKRPTQ